MVCHNANIWVSSRHHWYGSQGSLVFIFLIFCLISFNLRMTIVINALQVKLSPWFYDTTMNFEKKTHDLE